MCHGNEMLNLYVIRGIRNIVLFSELRVDCRPDYMSLVWTDGRSQADPSLFRLGSCFPTTVGPREATFSVTFDDCNFRRLVSTL